MNKAYTYELNLLGGVLRMALKLSLPLSMSAYLERIALYAEHVKSKGEIKNGEKSNDDKKIITAQSLKQCGNIPNADKYKKMMPSFGSSSHAVAIICYQNRSKKTYLCRL